MPRIQPQKALVIYQHTYSRRAAFGCKYSLQKRLTPQLYHAVFPAMSGHVPVFGDNLVDEARRVGGLLADGFAGEHHLRRLLQAHQPREPLRAAEARNDTQLQCRSSTSGKKFGA